jgi:hypothetical protein
MPVNKDDQIERLFEQNEKLQNQLTGLVSAVKGDSYSNPGIGKRVTEVEKKQLQTDKRLIQMDSRFDKIYNRVLGICLGVSIATGVTGWAIKRVALPAKAVPAVTHIRTVPLSTQSVLQPAVPLDTIGVDSAKHKQNAKKRSH